MNLGDSTDTATEVKIVAPLTKEQFEAKKNGERAIELLGYVQSMANNRRKIDDGIICELVEKVKTLAGVTQ